MKKNIITNKITPCCGLPFSVIYWWVSNLTLNSEADREFIISKISQGGIISVDAWKILINSGTLEADASLTKAEFLAWFDCGRQPSCEQLRLIIEGYEIGNWSAYLESIEEINDAIEDLKNEFSLKYFNDQKANGVSLVVSDYTKEILTYKAVEFWHDGSPMTDLKVDGTIFKKKGNTYVKLTNTTYKLSLFGADVTGQEDCSTQFQKAIDICVLLQYDLELDGKFRIDNQLFIDRLADDPKYRGYFTIKGGEIIIDSTMSMFSTRLPYVSSPVSQLIKFENVRFEAISDYLGSYVLEGNKFLRMQFTGCTFTNVRLLYAVNYIQSIYLFNCNIRFFRGQFLESLERTYDFKFNGCLMEQGETGLKMEEPYGCSVIGSTLEGLYGTAIIFKGSQGIEISGNYFEANAGGDVNMLGAKTNHGVSISGNFMYTTAVGVYSILWGNSKGAVSKGNSSLSNLHYFANSELTKDVEINDSAEGNLSNVPIIKHIEDGVFTLTTPNTGVTINQLFASFNRVGKMVTFSFGVTVNTNAVIESFKIDGFPFEPSSAGVYGSISYTSLNQILVLDGDATGVTFRKNDMTEITCAEASGQAFKVHGTFFTI